MSLSYFPYLIKAKVSIQIVRISDTWFHSKKFIEKFKMSVTYYSNPKASSPGLVFIFNYTRYFKQTMVREGSSIDRDLLKNLFRSLGFDRKDIHVKEDLPQRDLFMCLNNSKSISIFTLI